MYEAVIFDNDGVLVGSTRGDDLLAASRRTFAVHGIDDPDQDDVEALAWGVGLNDLKRLAANHGVDPQALWETRDRYASAFQMESVREGHKQPFDDADVIHDIDVPMAVVSSNQQTTLRFLLDRYGYADRFVSLYGRDPVLAHVEHKKPSPYFLQRAMDDMERARGNGPLDPDDVLMVGDSGSDVRAAHAAGVDAAFVQREEYGYRPDAEVDHDLSSLAELRDLVGAA